MPVGQGCNRIQPLVHSPVFGIYLVYTGNIPGIYYFIPCTYHLYHRPILNVFHVYTKYIHVIYFRYSIYTQSIYMEYTLYIQYICIVYIMYIQRINNVVYTMNMLGI